MPNLEGMAPFLRDALGLTPDPPVILQEQEVVVQFWRAGDTALELLAPLTPTCAMQRFLDKRGQGMHHLCFEVDDIQSELDRMAEMGLELVDRKAWLSPHGLAAYLHPRAGHGVSVELRQHV